MVGVGKVSLITIIDVVSRLKVESYPCLDTTKPPLEAYQLMLRRAFLTVGLPRRITLDHGTVFYDNTSASPFPTRLHLWLLALGIDICFTRKRRPTDHAKIERTHQTMTLQALLGQHWPDQTTLWAGLDARRAMRESAHCQLRLTGSSSLTGLSTGSALKPLLSARMGSRDARPGPGLCVPGELSLVSPHTGQRAARPWGL